MDVSRERIVILIGVRAAHRMEDLAGRLMDAPAADREALQAGLAFERWLLESCRDAVMLSDNRPTRPV